MHIPLKLPLSTRFRFLRHANADPGRIDAERPVSQLGKTQIERLRARTLSDNFDLLISSPTRRTRETSQLLLGEKASNMSAVVLTSLQRLDDAHEDQHITTMFEELEHASLATYFGHPLNRWLRVFGFRAANDICQLTHTLGAKSVLVVSHGVLLPAIIHEMFLFDSVEALALKHCFGECGAVDVIVGNTLSSTFATVVN
jgi:broad specificity phosphatase PhoE